MSRLVFVAVMGVVVVMGVAVVVVVFVFVFVGWGFGVGSAARFLGLHHLSIAFIVAVMSGSLQDWYWNEKVLIEVIMSQDLAFT